jgi:hypothetical protein
MLTQQSDGMIISDRKLIWINQHERIRIAQIDRSPPPVVALVEMQDLNLADHAVVVDDDPKLDLNTHALPKNWHCRSDYLSADATPDHHDLPQFAMAHVGASMPNGDPPGDTSTRSYG